MNFVFYGQGIMEVWSGLYLEHVNKIIHIFCSCEVWYYYCLYCTILHTSYAIWLSDPSSYPDWWQRPAEDEHYKQTEPRLVDLCTSATALVLLCFYSLNLQAQRRFNYIRYRYVFTSKDQKLIFVDALRQWAGLNVLGKVDPLGPLYKDIPT